MDKKIKQRKLELQYPDRKNDINSHIKTDSVKSPTEELIALWDSDVRLNSLYVVKDAMEGTLEVLDEQLTEIFYRRWQHKQTWEEIGHAMNIKPKHLEAKRRHILELFGRKRGML
ncbi:transcriptional regulator [Streptococcus uberis]|uniref:transcriptional regulator n=1 Tax=Streptococcus uberis TaxID=1349 RepID=UPI001FF48046|nr:transcriptional regulator [Streptococcus uberis]